MLTDTNLQALAEAAGVKAEELKEAITSEEEKELELNPAQRFTDDDLQTRVTNELNHALESYAQKELDGVSIQGETPEEKIHNLGKRVYDDARTASVEMFVKDWKKQHNADFQGKDLDSLINHIKSQKRDTGELEQTIEQLRRNLQEKEQEFDGIRSEYEQKLSKQQVSQLVRGVIPDNLIDTIKPDHVYKLFNATYDVELKDGKPVVKDGGEVLKDKQLLNPLSLEQVMGRFVEENGWLAQKRSGRGGGDDKGGQVLEGITSKDAFYEYLKDREIKSTSRQALEVLNKLPKDVQEEVLKLE